MEEQITKTIADYMIALITLMDLLDLISTFFQDE